MHAVSRWGSARDAMIFKCMCHTLKKPNTGRSESHTPRSSTGGYQSKCRKKIMKESDHKSTETS